MLIHACSFNHEFVQVAYILWFWLEPSAESSKDSPSRSLRIHDHGVA